MSEKDLGITEVRGAKANISDLQVYGDGDTFALLCKASSKEQGWMKSTKVCNTGDGCIVQVTTQQRNPDGSYAVAEALAYVPNMNIDITVDPRRLVLTNDLSKVSTKELSEELEKREGIKVYKFGVEDEFSVTGKNGGCKITGPATVLINQD